jgi:hypothetical protein
MSRFLEELKQEIREFGIPFIAWMVLMAVFLYGIVNLVDLLLTHYGY